jgi:hypothetical protein
MRVLRAYYTRAILYVLAPDVLKLFCFFRDAALYYIRERGKRPCRPPEQGVFMSDVYEKLYLEELKEFDEFCQNEAVNKSLDATLSNSSDETDYEAWSAGCGRFLDDNYDILKKVLA